MTGQPLDIKIESRNVGMTPRWKTEIERRVQALETGIIRPPMLVSLSRKMPIIKKAPITPKHWS